MQERINQSSKICDIEFIVYMVDIKSSILFNTDLN